MSLDEKDGFSAPEGEFASFAERAYLAYAMSVVRGRALPACEDGQKPVQRRILFAMRELGNRHDAPFKKSARIVGDVIGKFHPHGDSSVYEAAVRMAQDFSLRYPLIQGQGNFGSRDGDGAAAMRYTEVRLTRFAEEILLAELDRGTVEQIPTYDGSLNEPQLLPARLPVSLLNGASGIAVGMATEIPPHNINEIGEAAIAALKSAKATDADILAAVSGPDFPGGGQIISSPDEIAAAYQTGRGSLRVRARWEIEKLSRGQYRIVVTELPTGTSAAKVLSEIEAISNPQPAKGKKSISPDDAALKQAVLAVLDGARDDSDREHPVRLVLEPATSRVEPDALMALLLVHTSLETSAPVNLVMVGRDGRPRQAGLAHWIREWAAFRLDILEKRLRHRLGEVLDRLHILEGRKKALLNIDKVIKVIREADEPKPDLMTAFKLTERQAEDILEIRLRQLARLEAIKIDREMAELGAEKKTLDETLESPAAMRKLAVSEVKEDVKRFGDMRRTLVEAASRAEVAPVEVLTDDPVTLICSRNGFLRMRSGHGIDAAALTWKDGDGPLAIVETRTSRPVNLLGTNGRAYQLRALDIPGGKGDGVPATSLVDLAGGKVAGVISHDPETWFIFASDAGYGFFAQAKDLATSKRAGKSFLAVPEGSSALTPQPVNLLGELCALSEKGKLLVFAASEVNTLSGGGKGVTLMRLGDDEKLVDVRAVTDALRVVGAGRGGAEKELPLGDLDLYRGSRARSGRMFAGAIKVVKALA